MPSSAVAMLAGRIEADAWGELQEGWQPVDAYDTRECVAMGGSISTRHGGNSTAAHSGQPWTSITNGRFAPIPARAMWRRVPAAVTKACCTPVSAGCGSAVSAAKRRPRASLSADELHALRAR